MRETETKAKVLMGLGIIGALIPIVLDHLLFGMLSAVPFVHFVLPIYILGLMVRKDWGYYIALLVLLAHFLLFFFLVFIIQSVLYFHESSSTPLWRFELVLLQVTWSWILSVILMFLGLMGNGMLLKIRYGFKAFGNKVRIKSKVILLWEILFVVAMVALMLAIMLPSLNRWRYSGEFKNDDNNNHKQGNLSDMVKIDSCEIFSDKLVISYVLENTYNYDIWFCEGINGVGKADIGRKGKVIFLRLFSSLPFDENTLYYISPLAYYSQLSADSYSKRTISIDLPITSLSPFDSDDIRRMSASRLIFQIGFITADDINKLGVWAKKDLNEMLLVPVIRDVKIDEKIIQVEMDDLKIPVR